MTRQPRSFKSGLSLKLSLVSLLLTALVVTVLGVQLYHFHAVTQIMVSRQLRLKELAGTIVHLDEVLTMSARMAAATGNSRWEERYRRFEPQLDETIKEALRSAPEPQMTAAIAQMDVANVKLVAMENQAFDLVRRRELQQAQEVLFSEQYENQKLLYAEGINRAAELLKRRAEFMLSSGKRRVVISLSFVCVLLPTLLLAWWMVLRTLRKSQLALVTLNRTLDQKVAERTADLSRANDELTAAVIRHQRAERRLAIQYAITNILAESTTSREACLKVVQVFCEQFDWQVGVVWHIDREASKLYCADCWHAPSVEARQLVAISRTSTYAPGIGLPGRVWTAGKAVWVPDVSREQHLPRGPFATKDGLHCAFGFPILIGADVIGTIEFFGREVRQPDQELLQIVSAIGMQIGQFIERRRLEQQREEQAEVLQQNNTELARRERIMHSLIEDFETAKDRIERQARELWSANAKLRELAALKDEFVAKVSHELRTPLTSIKEGLSLILDGALGPTTADQQDFVQTMDGDIDRLTELINNMLDLSKIEAGRLRLVRARLDIRGLIESVMRSYQPILGRRKVLTKLADVPPVFVDGNRMLQVFTNLLSNALKFTPEGGTITFQVSRQNGFVAVSVQDTGPGIASTDLPKLFQKFSQVGQQEMGRPRGTGLGLAVCKELTELHGGHIEVASDVGQGATFTVLLPIYNDSLALGESFRDLLDADQASKPPSIALVAIQTAEAPSMEGSGQSRQVLDRIAHEIRQSLHREDIVLTLEPSWVVVLAIAEHTGAQAIIKRLHAGLPDGPKLQFGVALFPADAREVVLLFEHAARRVGRGLSAIEHLRSADSIETEAG